MNFKISMVRTINSEAERLRRLRLLQAVMTKNSGEAANEKAVNENRVVQSVNK